MKVIGFIGTYDKTDLLIHIAKITTSLGLKTLIIDSTINQKAKYVVPVINPTKTYVTEFEDFDVAVGFKEYNTIKHYLGIQEKEELDYDVTLIDIDSYEGFKNFEIYKAEQKYFVTSFDLFSLKKGLEILSGLDMSLKMTKILFSKEMLPEENEYLNFLSEDYKIVWDDYKIYFPLDIGDQSAIVESQRVSKIKFKNLSNQYKEGLLFAVEKIFPEIKDSEIKRIIKNIEKGV